MIEAAIKIKKVVEGTLQTYLEWIKIASKIQHGSINRKQGVSKMPKICDPPPFKGGQSMGVRYKVSYRYLILNDNGSVYIAYVISPSSPLSIWGKISAIRVRLASNGAPRGVEIIGYDSVGSPFTAFNFGVSWGAGQKYRLESILVVRHDGLNDTGGDPPQTNCRCSDDSCRVDCASESHGFCCIDHSFTNALLNLLQ